MIVATAGHVDHGKTALIKALTGVDTDRLPEEKARGLSIDLGFAYVDLDGGRALPGEAGFARRSRVLGFIDVPGHERFIRNMLAGVTGIDFALLVIAADDGVMPQTEEHLAILDLLGVTNGAVAVTKTDRVERGRVAEVVGQANDLLAGTGLAGRAVFPLSAVTGAGVAELRAHLEDAARTLAPRPADGNFRLAIDRRFTVAGAGLVVTGTVFSGKVKRGDMLVLSPQGIDVRVRAIHAERRQSETASAGQRAALNIAGADLKKITPGRGDWVLAAAAHGPGRRIDARIRVLASENRALGHFTPVHVHLGAAHLTGRVAVLEGRAIAPGASGLVQLVLDQPLGAARGDGLILRDQSARRTIAGGFVVDPFAPARGRSRPSRLRYLAAMELGDAAAALDDLLAGLPGGLELDRFARAWNLTPEEAADLWPRAGMIRAGDARAPIGLAPEHWEAQRVSVVDALKLWHARAPHSPGMSEHELRRALPQRIDRRVFDAVIEDLLGHGTVRRDRGLLRLPGHRAALTPGEAALWQKLRPLLEDADLRPPMVAELAAALGLESGAVKSFLLRAQKLGLVLRLSENHFFPLPTIIRLAEMAETLAAGTPDGLFTAAVYRDHSGIGRNLTIRLLEFFDRSGFTRRVRDDRRVLKPAAEIFGAPPT